MHDDSSILGSREQRLDEVLAEYFERIDEGQEVDKQVFLEQHFDVADELRAIFNDLEALDSLADVRLDDDEATTLSRTSASRYSVFEFHASGGLGRIYTSQDADIRRQVAIKTINPRWRTHQGIQARFLREAQITGQLEHPNIVPVYEVVRNEEGEISFYSMQLLRGQTLRAKLREYHAHRKNNNDDRLALHDLVRSFLYVCHAVQYAHSRSVIHRDLKPDNVMIGKFGTVMLLDWGLAKLLDEQESLDSILELSAVTQIDVSSPGFEPGTPAYMSPEQAAADSDRVGKRTDVYGLGAILFEILTAEVPHQGESQTKLCRKIVENPSPDPARRQKDILPSLAAICRKAIAYRPEDRYQGVALLAEDIQRWLADEPVSVYREPLVRRAERWVRHHRTLASTVAGVVAAVVVLTFIWSRVETARDRSVQVAVNQLIRKGTVALETGRLSDAQRNFSNAFSKASERPRLLHFADAALESQRNVEDRIRKNREYEEFEESIRLQLSNAQVEAMLGNSVTALQHCETILNQYDQENWSQRFEDENLDTESVGRCREFLLESALLAAATVITSTPAEEVDAALPDATAFLRRGLEIYPKSRAALLLLSEYLDQSGQKDAAKTTRTLAANVAMQTAFDYFVEGDILRRESRFDEALERYGRSLQENPNHFWSHVRLGSCWQQLRRPDRALGYFDQAIRLQPEAAWLYSSRAIVHGDLGMWQEALADLSQADAKDPQFYGTLNNRGVVFLQQAMESRGPMPHSERISLLRNAEKQFQQCLERRPQYLGALNNLGQVYLYWGEHLNTQKDDVGAMSQTRKAADLFDRATRLEPGNVVAWINLGVTKTKLYEFDAARRHLERAEQMVPDQPQVALALGRLFLSRAESDDSRSDSQQILADLNTAIGYFDRLIEQIPNDVEGYIGRARTNFKIFQQGIHSGKKLDSRLAESITEDLGRVESIGSRELTQRQIARLMAIKATVLARQHRYQDASTASSRALQFDPEDTAQRVRRGWNFVLGAYQGLKDFEAALKEQGSLDPKLLADAHAGRGYVLAQAGNDRAAVEAAERAVSLAEENWQTLFNAACVYGVACGVARVEHQDDALVERYAQRAIDLLLQANEAGLNDATIVAEDRALVHLRDRAEFKQLIKEIRSQESTISAQP